MTNYQRILFLGLCAASCLLITVFLGITGLNFKVHKIFGITTFGFALAHMASIAIKNNSSSKK